MTNRRPSVALALFVTIRIEPEPDAVTTDRFAALEERQSPRFLFHEDTIDGINGLGRQGLLTVLFFVCQASGQCKHGQQKHQKTGAVDVRDSGLGHMPDPDT